MMSLLRNEWDRAGVFFFFKASSRWKWSCLSARSSRIFVLCLFSSLVLSLSLKKSRSQEEEERYKNEEIGRKRERERRVFSVVMKRRVPKSFFVLFFLLLRWRLFLVSFLKSDRGWRNVGKSIKVLSSLVNVRTQGRATQSLSLISANALFASSPYY